MTGQGLDWVTDILPVLEGVYEAWKLHPDPVHGVGFERVNEIMGREPDDASTQYALIHLVGAGYLKRTALGDRSGAGPAGPRTVLLAEKGLQRVANWPSSDGSAMYAAILAEIDKRIASSEITEEERTKLQRLRDFATGVGHDVLVAVLTREATERI